jgi:hypothetical protein
MRSLPDGEYDYIFKIHFIILPFFSVSLHKSRSKGAEKTLYNDFVPVCIHLTASPQSVYSCFAPVDHNSQPQGIVRARAIRRGEQGKAFSIVFDSPRLFSMKHKIYFTRMSMKQQKQHKKDCLIQGAGVI